MNKNDIDTGTIENRLLHIQYNLDDIREQVVAADYKNQNIRKNIINARKSIQNALFMMKKEKADVT